MVLIPPVTHSQWVLDLALMIHPEIDELVGEYLLALSASHSRRQISCKLLVLCFSVLSVFFLCAGDYLLQMRNPRSHITLVFKFILLFWVSTRPC